MPLLLMDRSIIELNNSPRLIHQYQLITLNLIHDINDGSPVTAFRRRSVTTTPSVVMETNYYMFQFKLLLMYSIKYSSLDKTGQDWTRLGKIKQDWARLDKSGQD